MCSLALYCESIYASNGTLDRGRVAITLRVMARPHAEREGYLGRRHCRFCVLGATAAPKSSVVVLVAQLLDRIPHTPRDLPVHLLVTEEGVLRFTD